MSAEFPARQYRFPPITEAVVEFRFASPISRDEQDQISSKSAKYYPNLSEISNRHFHIEVDKGTAEVTETTTNLRRTNADENEIFLITPQSFNISQLPLYEGWVAFRQRFQRDWEIAKSILGYRKLERLGIRFINRLDFPFEDDLVHPAKYLNVYINHPTQYGVMQSSAIQTRYFVEDLNANMTIQSATVESPLPKHLGILLDIDIGREDDVPQKDDDIFTYFEQVRLFKNQVFEASITDATRERFSSDLRLGS